MLYFINIGSNLGQRRLNLSRAMRAVASEFGDFQLSHVVESAPWGYDSENNFLNVGMAFHTERTPEDVLDTLQHIERNISAHPHRTPDGRYADRIIDIDIVAADNLVISTDRLTIPHPHLAEREFFLAPLQELAPEWHHPITGLTAEEMLARMEEK